MSVTEDAPAPTPAARRSPVRLPGSARRASPWWWLVAGSALLLIVVAARPRRMVGGDARDAQRPLPRARHLTARRARPRRRRRRDHRRRRRRRRGPAHRADLVQPSARRSTRSVSGGVLRITSRCPDTVLGELPGELPRRGARQRAGRRPDIERPGRVSGLNGVRASGRRPAPAPIAATGFCGFSLRATSASGDVSAAADCSPDRLELRSRSGDVRAVVPDRPLPHRRRERRRAPSASAGSRSPTTRRTRSRR